MNYLPARCDGCCVCTAVCPLGAVVVEKSAVVFLDSCTQCDLCAQACPTGAILQDGQRYEDRWIQPVNYHDVT